MANPDHQKPDHQTEAQQRMDEERILEHLRRIKNTLIVLSGKGGVGKSTVAVNLALSLALAGKKVGLLDIDLHGPSIPKLLNLESKKITTDNHSIQPIAFGENLKVMSIGFFLPTPDHAVIWRGPMKTAIIHQLIRDVEWGDLDYLVIDSPPGTGDEPLTIIKLIGPSAQPIIVTTPQELALEDVRKCLNFCRMLNLDVLGLIENMSGFLCPHCGAGIDVFKVDGGRKIADELNIPFLGSIALDPTIVSSGDEGKPLVFFYAKTKPALAFEKIRELILARES